MLEDSPPFHVGFSDRIYAQISDTPPEREILRDEEGSGWAIEPDPELTQETILAASDHETEEEHFKRLETLSSPEVVAALRNVVNALAQGKERHREAAAKIKATHSRPVQALVHPSGKVGLIAATERERLNPLQMLETKGRYQYSYTEVVREIRKKRPYAKFSLITFTIPHWKELPLRTQIEVIREAFSNTVKGVLWKRTVRGFVRSFETPYGKNGWHCHVHVFAECGKFDIKELTKVWQDRVRKAARKVRKAQLKAWESWQAGGSHGDTPFVLTPQEVDRLEPLAANCVDVRMARKPQEAVGYVAKMELLAVLEPELICELYDALQGVKLIRGSQKWGAAAKRLYALHLRTKREEEREAGIERKAMRDISQAARDASEPETVMAVAKACFQVGFRRVAIELTDALRREQERIAWGGAPKPPPPKRSPFDKVWAPRRRKKTNYTRDSRSAVLREATETLS